MRTSTALMAALAMTGAGALAVPASAETVAQLDAQSRATENAASGLALARQEIEKGDLLGAMATLERVLFNHPKNAQARALHASLFCRIDDRRGATVELDALRGGAISPALAEEARAPCRRRS